MRGRAQDYKSVISVETLTCPKFRASFYWTHPSASLEASMWKALLAGTTALMIAGSSVCFAQQPAPQQPQRPQVGSEGRPHWRPSEQDVNVFTDARIAAIKAGLKLTPD